jgi:putative hydrolase of the HAD superfamily
MPRALLFDLDDTLYGYAPCNEAALQAVHGLLSAQVTCSAEEFRSLHDAVRTEFAQELSGQAASHNRSLFFKRIVERLVGTCQIDLAVDLFDRYWRVFLDSMQPAPDAQEVLSALGSSHELALVSNHTTDIQLRKLRQLGFQSYFGVVVTSEEVGVEKPDPRVFLRALTALGVEASEAVMIGDDLQGDIHGARAAGLATVLTTEFSGREVDSAAADVLISSLAELPAGLASL